MIVGTRVRVFTRAQAERMEALANAFAASLDEAARSVGLPATDAATLLFLEMTRAHARLGKDTVGEQSNMADVLASAAFHTWGELYAQIGEPPQKLEQRVRMMFEKGLHASLTSYDITRQAMQQPPSTTEH